MAMRRISDEAGKEPGNDNKGHQEAKGHLRRGLLCCPGEQGGCSLALRVGPVVQFDW